MHALGSFRWSHVVNIHPDRITARNAMTSPSILPRRWPALSAAALLLFACAWYLATLVAAPLENDDQQRQDARGPGGTEVAVTGRGMTVPRPATVPGAAIIGADQVMMAAAKDIEFHYIASDQGVVVRGVMPDHASVTAILSMMKRLHGSRFKNELVVDPDVSKPEWLDAAIDAISTLYGHPEVELAVQGDRAVVRGSLRDDQARVSVVNALQERFRGSGVRVEDRVGLAEASKATHLTLTKIGDHVELAGQMPSERHITKLVAVARIVFSGLSVSDRLSADEDNAEPEWLDAVISLMPELTAMDRAGIKTDGHTLTLAGEVQTPADKRTILERAEYVLGDLMPIEDRLIVAPSVSVPATATPEPSAPPETAELATPPGAAVTPAVPPAPAELPPAASAVTEPAEGGLAEQLAQLDLAAIRFESGSARLARSGHAVLDQLAGLLQAQRTGHIEISGHTDSSGSEAYNLKLSEQRARTVRNYLITQGVEPQRLTSVGHGEKFPIASNASAAGKARNRRIEIKVQAGGE